MFTFSKSLFQVCRYVLSILLVVSFSSVAAQPRYAAKVVGVSDGDTLSVLKNGRAVKVRLWGIDCPETGQDFGARAKQQLSALVFGKVISVIPKDTDRYGREVAVVESAAGEEVNYLLVQDGLCWWYETYAPRAMNLRAAQESARQSKKGVWSRPDAIPPWEFRRNGASQRGSFRGESVQSAVGGAGPVMFNTKSGKHHSTACKGALACTRNCVPVSRAEAVKRGGVACRMCGGRR